MNKTKFQALEKAARKITAKKLCTGHGTSYNDVMCILDSSLTNARDTMNENPKMGIEEYDEQYYGVAVNSIACCEHTDATREWFKKNGHTI